MLKSIFKFENKKVVKVKLLLGSLLTLVFPLLARAANEDTKALEANLKDLNPSFGDPYSLVKDLTDRMPYYLGGLALLAIIYSGAMYIASFGDPTKMEQAKKNLSWTVIGIVAIVAVYAVISIILWVSSPDILK